MGFNYLVYALVDLPGPLCAGMLLAEHSLGTSTEFSNRPTERKTLMKYCLGALRFIFLLSFVTPAYASQELLAEEKVDESTQVKTKEDAISRGETKQVNGETKQDKKSDSEETSEKDSEKSENKSAAATGDAVVDESAAQSTQEADKSRTPVEKTPVAGVVEKLGSGKAPKMQRSVVKTGVFQELQGEPEKSAPAWAGSSVAIQNSYNATAFLKTTNPDFRPNYRVNFLVLPAWSLNEMVTLSGRWGFAGSFYSSGDLESDSRLSLEAPSFLGQDASHQAFSSSDLTLSASARALSTIPLLEAGLGAQASLTLPTSDYSLFATPMYFGVGVGGSLSRSFSLLGGLEVVYSLGFNKTFYESYDGALAVSSYASGGSNCLSTQIDDAGIARCLSHGGLGQPLWGMENALRSSLRITDWLSIRASLALSHSMVKDFSMTEDKVSIRQESSSTVRYVMAESLSASFTHIPYLPYLTVSTGIRGVHSTLGLDSDYLHPFDGDYLNYLRAFINLNFNIYSIVDEFS